MEVGNRILCMARVPMSGVMVESIKVSIKMVRKKDMVFTLGLMGENSKAIGKTVTNTAKVRHMFYLGEVTYKSGSKEKAVWIMGKPLVISKS
jgi:hypothetical protein